MEKIESFKVNHLNLFSGLYVSRKDSFSGVTVTTFDMRFTAPNREKVMEINAIHTIEHLGATYFRNSEIKDKIVYFGPMGCSTGFYLVVFGDISSSDILPYVLEFCNFTASFSGEIPGATPKECGNYSAQNLPLAKEYVKKYYDDLIKYNRLSY